jgi:hypothetical protein
MRFEESAQKKEQRSMVIQQMLLKDELSSREGTAAADRQS